MTHLSTKTESGVTLDNFDTILQEVILGQSSGQRGSLDQLLHLQCHLGGFHCIHLLGTSLDSKVGQDTRS